MPQKYLFDHMQSPCDLDLWPIELEI